MACRLGQHFLADHHVRRRIADALRLRRDHLVVEIGAGRGALTKLLAERAGRVAAIEIDPRLAALLREQFARQPRVRVVEADILKLPLPSLVAELGYGRAQAVGNLPYYITSPILMRLFACADWLEQIVVMVQREVAERLTAGPGGRDYGLLSVTAQFHTRPELLFHIHPDAFRPPPKVESALVRMVVARRGAELGIDDRKGFFAFVRACFQQKRKTLRNNLKGRYPPERIIGALEAVGHSSVSRAEMLSLEQFAAMYKLLGQHRC